MASAPRPSETSCCRVTTPCCRPASSAIASSAACVEHLPPIWRSMFHASATAPTLAAPPLRVGALCCGLGAVSLPDELQARQGEQVVHLVHLFAEGDDC